LVVRRLVLVLLLVLPAGMPRASAEPSSCAGRTPHDPGARLPRYEPQPPGTLSHYCLFYGPYVIPGGQDLSRVDIDLALTNGFVVGGGPAVVTVDGSEPPHQAAHLHHSHWWFIDPQDRDYDPLPWMRWISGSGEELTRASFADIADAQPGGPRYGLYVRQGDRVAMINMLHNKGTQPMVLWIRIDLDFVHGSADEIASATGQQFHDVRGTLVGSTFQVPRGAGGADGRYVYPHDATGVGQVWTAPADGTIVIGAAHLHPGGERVIVTNWGSAANPCPDTRTDGIPGTTLYELDVINHDPGARFTEDFQIEITQPGFRAALHTGDRIVLNGVYDTSEHAWWDAMSFTGFYTDETAPVGPHCSVGLVDRPGEDPTVGMPNRPFAADMDPLCGIEGWPACDRNLPPPPVPVAVDTVMIAGFTHVPGDLGGPVMPVVTQGAQLTFVNADMGAYVRHSITSCPLPCDGDYVANYPLPDGDFDSSYLGWEPTSGGKYVPVYTLDTSSLEPRRYTYFCRVHPWMRGTFTVVSPA
jgi:hypothetical protein